MTPAEALMWALDDDPALRSSFMGVTILDQAPDPERFRRKMVEASESINALRERVVPSPFDLAPPRWELDPSFDLDYHVRRVALPEPGTRRQLLDLAALLYADPFDRARPLWQFTVVEGLEGGQAALLAKMHHVLSDGVGAIRLSVSFLDLGPDGNTPPAPSANKKRATPQKRPVPASVGEASAAPAAAPEEASVGEAVGAAVGAKNWFDSAAGALGPLLAAPGRGATALAGTLNTVARAPIGGVTSGISSARALARQLGLTDPARSPLWAADRSYAHRFDTLSLELGPTRAAAHKLGGTVNDAFVTIMATAAGDYHRAAGVEVDQLRMTMPISVRHDKEVAGNAWVPARLLVPAGPMPMAERFSLVSAALTHTKSQPSLNLGGGFAAVVRRLPTPVVVRFARQQTATVDFACSNVRGAPFDLWIAGARVLANHPFGPTAGVAFNATVLSYRDALDLGLNTDTGAVGDPGLLRHCIEEAAAELAGLA